MKYLHPHYLNLLIISLSRALSTMICRIKAAWWEVELGKGAKFRGYAIFRTLPDTQIIIGKNADFNSSHRSNLIGIYSPCMFSTIRGGAKILIGNNCGFSGTVIAAALKIRIGNNVRCGANTLITDSDWHYGDTRTGEDAAVTIHDNVWLGYGVKVLKGVTIGENSLIGAGSIVTKDIPANVVAVGNPCKVIKQIGYAE